MVWLACVVGVVRSQTHGPTQSPALPHLAGFLAQFLAIHPVQDGNGPVGHLLAVVLAQSLGLGRSPMRPIHPRRNRYVI